MFEKNLVLVFVCFFYILEYIHLWDLSFSHATVFLLPAILHPSFFAFRERPTNLTPSFPLVFFFSFFLLFLFPASLSSGLAYVCTSGTGAKNLVQADTGAVLVGSLDRWIRVTLEPPMGSETRRSKLHFHFQVFSFFFSFFLSLLL